MSDITILYDDLEGMSCGRRQLMDALNLARQLMLKHKKAFIAGMDVNTRIMVAPMSKRAVFCDPLSCIVDRAGHCWTVSDIHSRRIPSPRSWAVTTDESNAIQNLGELRGAVFLLYNRVFYERTYGRLDISMDRTECITRLQCALEDAAKMPYECGVSVLHDGKISVDNSGGIRVPSQEFLTDGILQIQKIKETAQKTYNKILKDHTASN